MKFNKLVVKALKAAYCMMVDLKDGEKVIRQGVAFGDLKNDTEIKADKVIGEMLRQFFSDTALCGVRHITIEGMGYFEIPDVSGSVWVCIDPLDGSLNFAMKGNTIGLPYSTCITILSKKDGATFADVIAAGVIDLRSGDLWLAWVDESGKMHSTINGIVAQPEKRSLDLGSMIVVGEMYYPENREKLLKIFAETKGWLRNPGSAAYEMACVASGQVAAFICDRQKQHELGAAYALVKGAGGVDVDFAGNDLSERDFLFDIQTPVILAGNQQIADELLRRLNQ